MVQITTQTITSGGNPQTLLGNDVEIGQPAPDVTVVAKDLSEFQLSSLWGNKVIISVVPSLETSVCGLQTKRFNSEAINLGEDVTIVTISRDLPPAQARWCGATGSDRIQVFSDFRNADFGRAYGVLIKESQLLARSVFVIDEKGILRYKQIVSELSNEPDYDEVLKAVKAL